MFIYKTKGVCSTEIRLKIENNLITNVEFEKGCSGNLLGISNLLIGMHIDEAIDKLSGIDCRGKGTSCPDQLAKALIAYKQQ